ncbi:uncharacterized protein LOC127702226 isoform X2 [Mytilus californianus]|uniref:uncharacterized protein LOC127702226 isoform X2 n=1 Tax=Mytilus californianus TaxID=6549 RepID=UPI002246F9F6|nr:uncharacterized protein LOC127702226 isoform X2 [Mytilus californianus]
MQAKGIHVEPLFSSPGNPHNTTALLDTITKLKQDVKLCQHEKNAAIEQLNCLISLIKRSWTGDYNASLHLANIVGLPPPEFDYRATHLTNTPVPDKSARAAMLWERLSIKLLDRNYAEIQEEIRQRQMLYMQNRQLYMDEILHHHQIDMGKTPVRKNSKTYEEVDRRFINAYSKTKQTGGLKQRVKSAPARPRTAKDMVNGANVKMKDLFVSNRSGEPQIPFTDTNTKSMNVQNSGTPYGKNRLDYDDPQRYGQKSLFDLDAVFGPDNENRKPQRPASAFIPRGQQSKSRPQSGHGTFMTQKSERPMKFETTRPVSAKTPGKKSSTLKSASEPNMGRKTLEPFPTFQVNTSNQDIEDEKHIDINDNACENSDDDSSDFDIEEYRNPPIKVRVESAPAKRPAHVDKFVKELQTMEEMERDFKKNAIHLQKKLGIDSNGLVS